jgi:prepilin-type N-terminal cleavage/methylation domain-containing protein/prepilin-type processing-associated H-X9-DG protein
MLTARHSKTRGFTLVELLVVIGIIAVLISVLLPVLASARRSAEKVRCLSALKQLHAAYMFYANDNKGSWPLARYQFPPPGQADTPGNRTRERRWHDLISIYINTPLTKDATGTLTRNLNADGLGAVPHIGTVRNLGNSILWGCPTWNRVEATGSASGTSSITVDRGSSIACPGYSMNSMNLYTFAPAPIATTNGFTNWATRTSSTTTGEGWFWKVNQWKRPAERCLLYDSSFANTSVTTAWPWWTTGGNMPALPDGITFTPDFNRHARTTQAGSVRPNDPALNMLFCDGHAATVSAKQAAFAIRFNVAAAP